MKRKWRILKCKWCAEMHGLTPHWTVLPPLGVAQAVSTWTEAIALVEQEVGR